jgi:hypothetical protein
MIKKFIIFICYEKFIKNKLFFFSKFIFHYGVIPNEFNVTHIIPLNKDKKITINDLNNLRPISISNILARIFERLLSNKMNEINKTHENQFGYKNKTSCIHALFVFKALFEQWNKTSIKTNCHIYLIKTLK